MSTTVDERVVEMRFDNRQFERNMADTMSTLDKFKQKLNLGDSAKGFNDVGNAVKRIDLSVLGNAAQKVGVQFNAMYSAADQWVRNITTRVTNAGERVIKAFTVDPIKTGLSEYETQINSVQTILANTESKGTTLQQVNAALDQLNTYADKTIYNFTEMTRNIGTFTAAGVDLNTSVSAIKGIANLAAVSGSTSQQASTAMYQLSQALAAGKVNLQDWNSVVNAGMGGQVFQDALKRTARAMGKDVDGAIKKYGSFRESLSKGEWLTTDVLTKTLEQFTMAAEEGTAEWEAYKASLKEQGYTEKQAIEILKMANTAEDAATKVKTFSQLMDTLKESAQSGWTQTWEILLGDFGEAKELFTEISDTLGGMIGKSAESRNSALSRGLSTGWKQLLGAGIADEAGFKEEISKVAKENGFEFDKLVKQVEEDGGDYNSALSVALGQGHITADTLSTAVTNMADKMGKMSAKELKAAGYTQEHVIQIQKLAKGLKDGEISMEAFTERMQDLSGRQLIISALWNSFNGLLGVLKPIKEAFREFFPAITGDQIYEFVGALHRLSMNFELSEKASDNLKRTFRGLFAILDIGKQILSAAFKLISPIFGKVDDAGGGILALTANIGDSIVAFDEFLKKGNVFGKVVEKIHALASSAYEDLKKFAGFFKEKIAAPGWEILQGIFTSIVERMTGVHAAAVVMKDATGEAISSLGDALSKSHFFNLLKTLWKGIVIIGRGIAQALGLITDGLVNKIGNANFEGIFDFINSLSFATIAAFIAKFVKGFSDITDSVGDFKESFVDILDGVKGTLEAYQTQLKSKVIMEIAKAIALLAASLFVLSLIDSGKLTLATVAISALFGDLMMSMKTFSGISGSFGGLAKAISAMKSIATSVLILSIALVVIADLEPVQLAAALGGIFSLTAIVVWAAKTLEQDGSKVIKGAFQMIMFSVAIKMLASVCKDMATLGWEQLAKGLLGVGGLMTAVSLFLSKTKFGGKAISNAIGMIAMAGALKIMASVCKDFGNMSWEAMSKGLTAIGVLLTEIAMFTSYTSDSKKVISTGIALTAIGAAMKIFASAMADMGNLSWEQIGKSLLSIGAVLLAVAGAMHLMPKNMIGSAVGLIAVGAALNIMADALTSMGGMSWTEIAKGLVALTGSLVILAISLNAMKGTLAGSAALLVAVASLKIFVPVLKSLGSMSWVEIAKGLLTLAATFAILGVAGVVLGSLAPTILTLAGAIALIGLGTMAAGVGLIFVAAGINALSLALSAGATAITAGIVVIISGLVGLIPVIVVELGKAIIAFCQVIADGAPIVGQALASLLLSALQVLVTCIPPIVHDVAMILVEVMKALVEYVPDLVTALFDLLIEVLDACSEKLPALIQAGVNLLMAFFSGVIDALKGIDISVFVQGLLGVGVFAAIIYALSALTPLIPPAMVAVLGMGALVAEIALILAAIGAFAQIPGLEWLINEGGDFLQAIGTAIGKFVGGIAGGMIEGISSSFPQLGSDLSAFMKNAEGFIQGAKNIDSSMMEGVKAIAETILILTAADILQGLTSWLTGGSSLASFGEQLPGLGTSLNQFATNLGSFDESKVMTITCAANAVKALAKAANEIPNEGGWAAKIFGDNSIATFGEKLPALGTNLGTFATNLGTFDEAKVTTVTCAANAVKAIAKAAKEIPNEGGWAAKIFGDNSLGKFGTNIEKLGTNLKKFVTNLGSFGEDKVSAVTSAVKAINSFATLGDRDLSKLNKNLPSFGDKIVGVGTDIKSFVNNLPASESVDVALRSVNNIVKTMNDVSAANADNMKAMAESMKKMGHTAASDFASALNDMDSCSKVASAATSLSIKVAVGLESKIANVKTAAENVVKEAVKAIEDKGYYDRFYEAGKYLVDGFAAGITFQTYKAEARARLMASSAAKAAKDELDINSPSRVFRAIGKSVPEGFIMGIRSMDDSVSKSAGVMASQAMTNMHSAISEISNMVYDDIDAQPTIRPIMDLSNIRYGVGAIDGMLAKEASIGAGVNLSSISSAMSQRRQTRVNDDVVSAINKLRGDIGNIGGTTYQINGISYEDGSSVGNALQQLVRAIKMEGRV